MVDTTWTYRVECLAQNLPYVADPGSLPTRRGLTPGSHMAAQMDSDQLSCRSGQLASGNETVMLKEAGVEALSQSGQPSLLFSTRVEFFLKQFTKYPQDSWSVPGAGQGHVNTDLGKMSTRWRGNSWPNRVIVLDAEFLRRTVKATGVGVR